MFLFDSMLMAFHPSTLFRFPLPISSSVVLSKEHLTIRAVLWLFFPSNQCPTNECCPFLLFYPLLICLKPPLENSLQKDISKTYFLSLANLSPLCLQNLLSSPQMSPNQFFDLRYQQCISFFYSAQAQSIVNPILSKKPDSLRTLIYR